MYLDKFLFDPRPFLSVKERPWSRMKGIRKCQVLILVLIDTDYKSLGSWKISECSKVFELGKATWK